MLWGALGIVAGAVVLDLLVHAVAVVYILPILERSPPFGVEPTPPNPDAERIAFQTPDGLTLRGSIHRPQHGSPRGLIVFCPEIEANHWSAMRYCRALVDAGFALLAFDFRNQGESDAQPGYTPIHWLTEYEVCDALAAVAYAQSRPDLAELPLGIFGISRGGGAALAVAARRPAIKRVACEGAFSISGLSLHYMLRWVSLYLPAWIIRRIPIWHFRMSQYLARIASQIRRRCRYTILESWLPHLAGRPALMIVGGRDTYVLPSVSEALFERFPQATSEQWLVPQAKHNLARQVDPAEYDRRIVEFFMPIAGNGHRPAADVLRTHAPPTRKL